MSVVRIANLSACLVVTLAVTLAACASSTYAPGREYSGDYSGSEGLVYGDSATRAEHSSAEEVSLAAPLAPTAYAGDSEGKENSDVGEELESIERYQPAHRLLTASSVSDCDRRNEYLGFMQRHPTEEARLGLDMSRRVRFRVVDEDNRPVNDAEVTVTANGQAVYGRTHADGVWDLYPSLRGERWSGGAVASIRSGQDVTEVQMNIPLSGDGVEIQVRFDDDLAESPEGLDLAFLIDVTGSMTDELAYVNGEVVEIVRRIEDLVSDVDVRVGATFYRDRGDEFLVRQIPFTTDVGGFAQAMETISADGGGDYEEDLNAGLEVAFNELEWSRGNSVRVLVVIADAPPQDYSDEQFTYREAIISSARQGIRLLPVAASGADRTVEFLFRAMGAATSTPYVYLTDHSGIGSPHLEADTSTMTVEYLGDLLTRLVVADLRGDGMHDLDFQQQAVAVQDRGVQVVDVR